MDSGSVPPPPPPPESNRNGNFVLVVLGGLITALLIVLLIVVVTRDSSDESAATTTSTSQASTADSTPPSTGTTATTVPAALFSLQAGDLLIAGFDGVDVVRSGSVVGHPIEGPVQNALATPDGSIVYHGPFADDFPDFWPPFYPTGAPTLRVLRPDGSDDVLYEGGDRIRMFEIAHIAGVAPGPSLVLLDSETTDDFPFRTDSIVVVPLDGSVPHVIPQVSAFESTTSGVTWMDGFFAVSFAGEGFEVFDALDLDGDRVPWPANPEPADTRDPEIHVWNLTRVGDTSLITYARSSDFPLQAPIDLVVYDTNSGVEVASVPILMAGFDVGTISASEDVIVVSPIEDTGSGDWPFSHSPVVIVDTNAFIVDGLDMAGVASVVE